MLIGLVKLPGDDMLLYAVEIAGFYKFEKFRHLVYPFRKNIFGPPGRWPRPSRIDRFDSRRLGYGGRLRIRDCGSLLSDRYNHWHHHSSIRKSTT